MSYNKVDFNKPIQQQPTRDNLVAQFLSGIGSVGSGIASGVGSALGGVGQFVEQQKQTPEGRRLLTNIIGGLTQVAGASPYVGAGIAEQSQRSYEQDIKTQQAQDKLLREQVKQQSEETQAKIKLEDDYRDEYNQNRVVKDSKEINAAISRMDNVWNEYLIKPNDRGRNALDQALVITFNKMLDPGSVVRESEFARTPTGQSLLSRMQGYQEKLAKGGVGLTDSERKEIIVVAKQLQEGQMIELEKEKQFYRDLAEQRGLDIENIFGKTKTTKKSKGKKEPKITTPDLKQDENKTGSVIKLKSGYSMEIPDA
jgi:hypothetical protein